MREAPGTRSPDQRRPAHARLLASIAMTWALSACAAAGQASPFTAASPACGGFHLDLLNEGGPTVEALVNDRSAGVLPPGGRIAVFINDPGFGQMPWHVVTRTSAGALFGQVLVSDSGNGPAQVVTVTATGLAGPEVETAEQASAAAAATQVNPSAGGACRNPTP